MNLQKSSIKGRGLTHESEEENRMNGIYSNRKKLNIERKEGAGPRSKIGKVKGDTLLTYAFHETRLTTRDEI